MFVSLFVFVLFLEGGGGGESLSLASKDLHHVQVLFSEFSSLKKKQQKQTGIYCRFL